MRGSLPRTICLVIAMLLIVVFCDKNDAGGERKEVCRSYDSVGCDSEYIIDLCGPDV